MSYAQPFVFTDAPRIGLDDYLAKIPAGLRNTQSLLQALYEVLDLPGYFGFNWDALSDCLRDFHWIKQRKIILQHADLPAIASSELRTYLDVLAEAEASWGPGEEHCLSVVFPTAMRTEVTRLRAGEGFTGQ